MSNSAPTVASTNIGEGVEQKDDSLTAVLSSTLSDEITFAPIGYPHASDSKNTPSARTPNRGSVSDFFGVTARAASGASSANGNSAGSTFTAQTVSPSKKLLPQNRGATTKQTTNNRNKTTIITFFADRLRATRAVLTAEDEEEFILKIYALSVQNRTKSA